MIQRRVLWYLGGYILLMIISVVFMPVWRELDWRIFAWLNRSTPLPVAKKVVLIDVPYSQTPSEFRQRISGLLDTIADDNDDRPEVVVLDTWISADITGLSGLQASIHRLQELSVPVYAGINPLKGGTRGKDDVELDPDYMSKHAQNVYGILHGSGHTMFNHLFGVLHYKPRLDFPDGRTLWSLPVILAKDLRGVPYRDDPVFVHLGSVEELHQRTYIYHHAEPDNRPFFTAYNSESETSRPATVKPDFRGKIVVVGSLKEDKEKFNALSGPDVLSFAISERILPKESSMRAELLESPLLLFIVMTGFAVLAVTVFWLMFRKLPGLRAHHWLVALVSAGICLVLLALWVSGLSMLNKVYPQISLVVISVLVSLGFTGWYTKRGLERKLILPPEDKRKKGAEELPNYDVFISYARTPENCAWVKANVYEKLIGLKKSDGSPLRVFFDERGIEPGEDWYTKLALAIVGSRFFLPVYTAEYFERKFCQFEMEKAAPRQVDLKDFIIALAREDVVVPKQYEGIQYLDVRKSPDFIERIAERIHKRENINPHG